jgi:hypothetical protein
MDVFIRIPQFRQEIHRPVFEVRRLSFFGAQHAVPANVLGSQFTIRSNSKGAGLVLDSVEAPAFMPGKRCFNRSGL